MNARNESRGGTILFLGTWFVLGDNTELGGYSFLAAIALMGIGWLALRVMGRAVSLQGARGWWLIAAMVALAALFLWLMPAVPMKKVFVLWAFVLPLIVTGATCAWLGGRFVRLKGAMMRAPFVLLPLGIAAGMLASDYVGYPMVWNEWTFVGTALLASVALAFGVALGATEPRENHDARFGTEDQFQQAGMSDER
jgi:hypothetical protein